MIREFKGDMFMQNAELIFHGCNALGLFGAGVAKIMGEKYPELKEEYIELCNAKRFNPGEVLFYKTEDSWIANMCTQFYPGRNAKIEYIVDSMAGVLEFALDNDIKTVSGPRVGCGIGSLSWDDVLAALEEEFGRHQVDIDIYYL